MQYAALTVLEAVQVLAFSGRSSDQAPRATATRAIARAMTATRGENPAGPGEAAPSLGDFADVVQTTAFESYTFNALGKKIRL
jgi:hypothetical protein